MKPANIPAVPSCLTAIQQLVSRNTAVWTLVSEDHLSCDATYDLMDMAAELVPTSLDEVLFLLVVAQNQVGMACDQSGELREAAHRRAKTALYNAVDCLAKNGGSLCPMVREYFMPECNHPQLWPSDREKRLAVSRAKSEALARDVFARLNERPAAPKRRGRS